MTTKLSLAAACALFVGMSSAYADDPLRLSDTQLDNVTGGLAVGGILIDARSGSFSTGGCPPGVTCSIETVTKIENWAEVYNDEGWGTAYSYAVGWGVGGPGTASQSEGFAGMMIAFDFVPD